MNLLSPRQMPVEDLLRKRKRLRRELLLRAGLKNVRIAVLGGVTTNELVDLLELLLLEGGFKPEFYQSEYNKFYEDAVHQPEALQAFRPDITYVHTHWMNIRQYPPVGAGETELREALAAELARFQAIWNAVQEKTGSQVIQNNFEHPPLLFQGNLEASDRGGRNRFVYELNTAFAHAANGNRKLLIQDLNGLAAQLGHAQWHDWDRWYSYKIPTTPEGSLAIAQSLASMIEAMLGKARKCLVLDLDNTLWGGVIGDDGVDRIQIGRETAVAEAYAAFQSYCLQLRERGILLAVCSKNNEEIARTGFEHPDSVLKVEHFSAFRANWEPKHENIRAIAKELNLGLDSFVFVDDNPAERAIVSGQLPMVLVPDIGGEVSRYPAILQAYRCFESVGLSQEDRDRPRTYAENAARAALESRFANYGEYLDSLQMSAEIAPFRPIYLERITQLINKTNQFNLTTRRYTAAEVENIHGNAGYIALYGKLTDSFGDNGLVSVIIGRREGARLHLDLWIMSCRVLKRDMELAMLDALVEHARAQGIEEIAGYYARTAKNAMVGDHYEKLGFSRQSAAADGSSSVWTLPVFGYTSRNTHIKADSILVQTKNG